MTLTRFQSEASGESALAPKVHVVTFGCQMNKYDSLLVEGRFRGAGYRTTDAIDEADVVLFNTCSVRDHAEERAWSWVGELKRAKRERPELVVGIFGCMAQRVEEEVFARAGHVDLVVGTRQFQHLPRLVEEVRERRREPGARARDRRLLATGLDGDVAVDRSREAYTGGRHGYLAVMRGCDLSCAFCIVPTTRGRVRSRPVEDLLAEARWMVSRGAQVITLLGQTVNSYGEDFDPPSAGGPRGRGRRGRVALADLLERLEELEGLERVRLVTLHPSYVTPALARAVAECGKVDRFLPLPAQAGSDAVLRRMKRGYTLDLYRRRADVLRAAAPDIELASDWIVGFPGESEADFAGSEAFLEEQGFAVNYVFKYDPRPGTSSAQRRADDVPAEVKKERNARLLAVAERVQRRRLACQVGRRVRVFVESPSERDERVLLGRTFQGLPVSFEGPAGLVGTSVELLIEEATAYGMAGRLCAPGRATG